jgi:hypothetical protein
LARTAVEAGDDGTNDLLVSDVIRTNEMAGRGDSHPARPPGEMDCIAR